MLQHHGAATRLLDFTRNAFIALWFAANASLDSDGLVVAIREEPGSYDRLRTEKQVECPLKDVLMSLHTGRETAGAQEKFALWEPRYLFDRMRVQQSLFVLGRIRNEKWGSAPFGLRDPNSKEPPANVLFVAVPAVLKRKLAEKAGYSASWESVFGFSDRYLFPELDGYANANSAGKRLPRIILLSSPRGYCRRPEEQGRVEPMIPSNRLLAFSCRLCVAREENVGTSRVSWRSRCRAAKRRAPSDNVP